jgi:hypothetical protein
MPPETRPVHMIAYSRMVRFQRNRAEWSWDEEKKDLVAFMRAL